MHYAQPCHADSNAKNILFIPKLNAARRLLKGHFNKTVANFHSGEVHAMQDLRLLAIETEFVVLEGATGEQYRLALDEAVRKALRNERGPRVESDLISPREIQDLVRSGHSVDEIVAKTSAPYAFVEKFAVPVLEELEHVVSSAQTVRLPFVGDRYGETNYVEFGVLIRERLDQLGASNVTWSARRNETGGWQVTCDFELESKPSSAKWTFDLRHLSLSPENEVALNLAANPKGDSLLAKPKPVVIGEVTSGNTGSSAGISGATSGAPASPYQASDANSPSNAASSSSSVDAPLVSKNLTMSLGETQEFAEVIPFGRGRNTTAQVPVIAAGTSAEISDDDEAEALDDAEDLLEGLRRRRDLRESQTGFAPILEVVKSHSSENAFTDPSNVEQTSSEVSDFDENTVWIDSADEVFVEEEDVNQDLQLASQPEDSGVKPAAPSVNPAKKGRASMPSWDQIVFGTKPDNKED
jgi:Protein of unknown function (DUF3071)